MQIRDIDLTEIKNDLTLIKAMLNSDDITGDEKDAAASKLIKAVNCIDEIQRQTAEGFIQAQIKRREHLGE